jgi:four helix bundle protein
MGKMDSVRDFRDLQSWRHSMALAQNIYQLLKLFPQEELYALCSQMRRSAISIPSNIAEGHSRHSTKEYIRFLYIAQGSAAELHTQLILAKNIGYILDIETLENDILSIRKMIAATIKTLQRKQQ